ncbi:MAG: hypothetical protein FWG12_06295 [Holophagaceae bacterium]|nr:hypothetical protein [Holophagaceae bacterium]
MLTFMPVSEEVSIGGHSFRVAALSMGVLRRQVMPLLEAGTNIMEAKCYDKVLAVCHQSVSRADPSISAGDLENALMLTDIVGLFQAVIRVSGLNRRQPEGEVQSQEAATPLSSGATSTDSSQPQLDGHTAISTPS